MPARIHHLDFGVRPDETLGSVEDLTCVTSVGRDVRETEDGELPAVLLGDLAGGDPEAVPRGLDEVAHN